jgi:uncharacterized phiE125 gp8 family phage protein
VAAVFKQVYHMLTLLDPPIDALLTLEETKTFLRVDTADDDVLILNLIAAATQRLDGRDGILGRCLRPQVWRWDFPAFPPAGCVLRMPLPPTIDVQLIEYFDTVGTRTTWAESLWRTIGGGLRGDLVLPELLQDWPVVLAETQPDTVSITFRAGYQDLNSPTNEAVPEPIRFAALMCVGDWYENRLNTLIGTSAVELPNAVMNLIAPYRVAAAVVA